MSKKPGPHFPRDARQRNRLQHTPSEPKLALSPPNIVFCVFDTMRRDGVGAYGGPSSTPNLDKFSREGVVYGNGVTPSPWTLPSHVSFLAGKYPSEHGLHESYETKGRDFWHRDPQDINVEFVAESLKKAGYHTVGISANPWLFPGTMFARGFEAFTCVGRDLELTEEEKEKTRRAARYGKTRREIVWHLLSHGRIHELFALYSMYRRVKDRERRSGFPRIKGGDKVTKAVANSTLEEPFFLFLNFMETHDPYSSYELRFRDSISRDHPGLSLSDLLGQITIPPPALGEIRRGYYAECSQVDSFFGDLLAQLKHRNVYDNCMIIATSDHGQALKEKNYYGHSVYLYDEIIRVPLIVKYPRAKSPPRKEGYQSLVNIPRMIKSAADGVIGEDLLTERVAFSESFGIPHQSIINVPEGLRRRFDVPRKAVYRDGCKITVNWLDMAVEELSRNGEPLDPRAEKALCESLMSEFSALRAREPVGAGQAPAFSAEEEAEITENLRNLGYA
jgi:arylsulfatase A-like enzyme